MIVDTSTRTRNETRAQSSSTFRRALHAFFATQDTVTGLLLRLGLAVTIFPHGAQKALGWFGGFGFKNTVAFFHQNGTPVPLAVAIIAAEFLGSFALIAGFFTRWSAFGIGLVMLGAVALVHGQNGFFMNWMGNQKGEGFEYFIPVLTIALALILKGGGKWAVDSVLARKIEA